MNRSLLISISLLIFLIGISCASATDLNLNDATLSSGLGGGGDSHFYTANVSPQYLGNVSPQYLGNVSPQYLGNVSPQYLGNVSPQYLGNVSPQYFERPSIVSDVKDLGIKENETPQQLGKDYNSRHQHAVAFYTQSIVQTSHEDPIVQLSAVLGSGLGGGGEEHYY